MRGKAGMLGANAEKAWNISNASYVRAKTVTGVGIVGIAFKSDGTRFYYAEAGDDTVKEYSLSTAWDVSTASYAQDFSFASQENNPFGLFFKPDGTKLYVAGRSGDDVNEYSLSSAWDISTASYVQNFSVASQDTLPFGISFKTDGTRMYVIGNTNDVVYEYSLSSAWDISTASYVQDFTLPPQNEFAGGLVFKPDGKRFYVTGLTNDSVYQYSLSSAWDISTASYDKTFAASLSQPSGIAFKDDGTRMYVMDLTTKTVYEYAIS